MEERKNSPREMPGFAYKTKVLINLKIRLTDFFY